MVGRTDPWLRNTAPNFVRSGTNGRVLAGYRLTESQGFPLYSSYLDGKSLTLDVPTMPRSKPPLTAHVDDLAAQAANRYKINALPALSRSHSGFLYDKPMHVNRLSVDVKRFERHGVQNTSPDRERAISPTIQSPPSKRHAQSHPGGYNNIWVYEAASPSSRFGREKRDFNTTSSQEVFNLANTSLRVLPSVERAAGMASPPKNGARFQYLPMGHSIKIGAGPIGA
mmetsp:Transcript_24357/g.67039  ORF Transcript_24357/g.67039 Transcript_24357/m.67039 type:complete len:226 (+) Transcript_24357:33-710(+)